ncbi:MAG: phosphoglucosamine mutase [Spirochaetia bacterium]|nr:phosphoglucosamine mutase [Spirochaetia bacterium]
MKVNLNSTTLKLSVSGMRGLFPDDINAANIPLIMHAFNQSVKPGTIAVARDNRPTGEAVEKIVTGVLQSLGRNVHSLGIVPTPTIKAYVQHHKLSGGIMISASHNPVQYTAFKFMKQEGFFFTAKENDILMENLKKNPESGQWGIYKKQGNLIDAHDASVALHINYVLDRIFPGNKIPSGNLKVAIDTLGACATEAAPALLSRMGIKFYSLFPEIQYSFPRPPEPVPSSLGKLSKFVVENKCDIGFAFDPDADRLAIIAPDGKAIGEELTLPIAMKEALFRKKGSVVVNLSSSLYNEYTASLYSCKVFRSKVGEANVVDLMKRKKAVFGGEGNGGVIDPVIPSFGRDSISAMGWILSLMLRTKLSLPAILEDFPEYFMRKEAITGNSKDIIKIANQIQNKYPKWKIDKSDGYHFISPHQEGWIHVRSSNTEPIIRILAEANSKRLLAELLGTALL